MTWTDPIDPPADGNAITRAFFITYVKQNLAHLRAATGGDPTAGNMVLNSTAAGAGAWTASPSITSLGLSAGLTVGTNLIVGGTAAIVGTVTAGAFVGPFSSGLTATTGTFSGAVTGASFAASGAVTGASATFTGTATAAKVAVSGAGTAGAPAIAFTSTEGGGTDGFYESGSHTPAIAVSGVQMQRWDSGGTNIGGSTAIQGQVTITGSGTYTGTWAAASDQRLKTAILPVQNALANILALQPITYRPSRLYRQLYGTAELESNRYQGLIAQDVQTVYPDLVTVNKDDNSMLAVDYSRLVVPLIAAVQELAARVVALETAP